MSSHFRADTICETVEDCILDLPHPPHDFATTFAFAMLSFTSRIRPFVVPVLATVVAALLLLIPGCEDPTVNVLQPTDQFQFSVFGTLNVAADTQVIRVEPLDDSIQVGAPPSLDATVVLENLDTGEQIQLQDSLSTFGTEPIVVHNFWTAHSIEPSTSYRVAVRRGGDPVVTATTTTPTRPPDLAATGLELPCTFSDDPNTQLKAQNSFTVTAQNVDRIASVVVRYPILEWPLFTRSIPHLKGVERFEGRFVISVFYRPDLIRLNPDPNPRPGGRPGCASPSDFARPFVEVEVAAGGPDWPQWRGVPFEQIARPDTFSNVQGGHGFVGGTYSKTIDVPVTGRN